MGSNSDIKEEELVIKKTTETKVTNTYKVFISRSIKGPHEYIELISLLQDASENDIIYIILNTPGGRCDSTIQICNAIQQSKARVITCATGTVASCGTLIFLSSNEYLIEDDIEFMIHNYSGGAWGKGGDIVADVNFNYDRLTKMFSKYYKKFLSKKEIEDLKKGQDYYFDTEETLKRLNKRVEWLKKKYKENDKIEPEVSDDGLHL